MRRLSTNIKKLLNILNDGKYHDGTSIGNQLKITRSAVWKMITKLKNYGIEIRSEKGTGYILQTPLNLLNKEFLKQNINYKDLDIETFETLPSTNDYLKNFVSQKKLRICLAELQTHGRGRLSRQWFSPFGQNIYFSLLFHLHKDVSELAGLALVAGLGVIKTLTPFVNPSLLRIKWPNDILYDQKKIAGILIDVQGETKNGRCAVIVGIGINVNMQLEKKNPINKNWTSLARITNKLSDRNVICVHLTNQLMKNLLDFEMHGLNFFLQDWNSLDFLFGKIIKLESVDKQTEGRAQGIDQYGRLLLELADKSLCAFSSGEISIKEWR